MEVKEKVVEKTVKVYELTEEELIEIKQQERVKGRKDILGYIAFAYENFYLKKNIAGYMEFMLEFAKFFSGKSDSIKNKYGYTFKDYIRRMGEK